MIKKLNSVSELYLYSLNRIKYNNSNIIKNLYREEMLIHKIDFRQ